MVMDPLMVVLEKLIQSPMVLLQFIMLVVGEAVPQIHILQQMVQVDKVVVEELHHLTTHFFHLV